MSAALLALLLSWPATDPALGAVELAKPAQWPNDPDYAPGASCLGRHELYSFTPTCAAALPPSELELGVGIRADRAWLWTTGRGDVSIAVLDLGFDWSDVELIGRVRLSEGEIPGPHDQNGDGAFTVHDFLSV